MQRPPTYTSLEETAGVDPSDVRDLRLVGRRATEIPRAVFELQALTSLSLESYACDLPEEIARLTELRWLRLRHIDARELPDAITELGNLRTLVVDECTSLERLPERLGNLTRLEWLIVTNNPRLRQIPASIVRCASLKHLDLRWNSLETLPEGLGALEGLERLAIKGNAFVSLPEDLRQVRKVEVEPKAKALYADVAYPASGPLPDEMPFLATSNPAMRAEVTELLAEGGLGEVLDTMLSVARRAVCLITEPDAEMPVGATRLGGAPDLPETIEHPMQDGGYYLFLAQIDLEEIAPFQDYLPRRGLLYFFVSDLECIEDARVIHWAGERSELRRFSYPPDAAFSDTDYTEPFVGVRAHPAAQPSFPFLYGGVDHLPEDARSLAEIEEDERIDAYHAILDQLKAEASNHHRMNAFVFTQHESPEEQAAEKYGGLPPEWMNLLVLGHDHHAGFCLWDAGTVTFTIHKADLAAGDFSRVAVSLESS